MGISKNDDLSAIEGVYPLQRLNKPAKDISIQVDGHDKKKQKTASVTPPSLPTTRSTFATLFSFTHRRHIPLVAISFFTATIVAAGRTAYAILLGKIFEVVSEWGAGALTSSGLLAEISQWCIYFVLLGLGVWLFSSIDIALWVVCGEIRARTTRETMFGALLGKTAGWYDLRGEGVWALLVQVQTQTRELQLATSQTLGFLVCDALVFIACFIVAFAFSWKLTLVLLSTSVPSSLILWAISRGLDPAIEGQKRELAEAAKHATVATSAIDIVKVYNAADQETFQFTSAIRRSANYYSRQVLANCGQMSYVKMWMIMLFVIGFYFAVVLVGKGELTPGTALTTFYAALNAFKSIETLGPEWLVLAKGMQAAQLLKNVAEDQAGESESSKKKGWKKPSLCLGDIRMNNVSFAYPSNPSNVVLKTSSFHFAQGEICFVVGRSGSGKSTLSNLLLRFYEPRTGRITVDGNDIATLDLEWLRCNITLIQQSSILFNDTFAHNVAFGATDPDNVPPEDIHDSCSMALLQSTIANMPDGINTLLGSGGYNLSGGQKQRLALARAKLRDPPVLVLDEITSGLDPVSRTLIMDAIRIWRKGRTTIIITHEVGHIEANEYVYVMEDGTIVQQGLSKEVAEQEHGLFASLLTSADDACSSRDSSEGESWYDSSSEVSDDEDEHPIQEATYGRFLRGSMISNTGMHSVGFFPRPKMTWKPELVSAPPPTQTRSRRASHVSLPSRPQSMNIVARQAREVQTTRTPNVRQSMQPTASDSLASLDSLDRFFLANLASKMDKKLGRTPTKGHKLPSLKAILKTVWPTLDKTGRLQLILGLLLCLVIAAGNPVFSYFFSNLISSFWIPEGPQSSGSKWAGYLAIVAVVDASATFFGYFFLEKVAQKWVNTLRAEAMKRILAQPKSWFDKASHSPHRITQCLDRNAEEMRKLVGLFVPILLTVSLMIVASLTWALATKWDLTLVALSGLPVAVGASRGNALMSDKWESIANNAATATSAIFSETFSNIKVVRALTLEKYFAEKHERSAHATYLLGYKRAGFVAIFYGLYQSFAFFVTALVFYYGAKLLSEGQTTVTDVLKVINLVLFSLGTAAQALSNIPQIAASKATATQILYYANLSHDNSHEAKGDKKVPSPLPVCMTNLRFAYPSSPQTEVLRSVNLQINPGTATAIVGSSGCGKSTIAALLLRLYEPLSGESTVETTPSPEATSIKGRGVSFPSMVVIPPSPLWEREHEEPPSQTRIASAEIVPSPLSSQRSSSVYHPTASVSPTPVIISPLTFCFLPYDVLHTPSLRTHISYVPQAPVLFPYTIAQNIAYGLPETSPLLSQENIMAAAVAAGIHDFVASLPQGYDTLVGEGGQQVSGGQAQRLCIARALARHPALLVLDEPTSSLDAQGAEAVRKVIQDLVESDMGMAVVVVTHSKEMMRIADTVVMVENGIVVETGSYEALVKKGGKFTSLVGGGIWLPDQSSDNKRSRARRFDVEEDEDLVDQREDPVAVTGSDPSQSSP
ncbi:putative ABC transporter expressed in the mitochondrial inner membrane [Podospora australis]|uniref:ABC transporter expressed in the mitochondrial inner membrane n=1 Tax=Podospora australis TaxID=1536484 RepID=A0AAN6WTG0_9PEZI|nr:putative ABC transporter expressed in the mitochondrial inner membrane [Podospora australis]